MSEGFEKWKEEMSPKKFTDKEKIQYAIDVLREVDNNWFSRITLQNKILELQSLLNT